MTERPWTPHHVPEPGALRRAVARAFPDVDAASLEPLGSGWEFDAWATADRWVFRFPRRAEAPAQLRKERGILALVRPVLGSVCSVPDPVLQAGPGPHFPWPFAGHRLIEGVPADHPGVHPHPGLARQLADVLGRIHGIDPEDALRAGAGVDEDGCRPRRQKAWPAAERLARAAGLGPVVAEASAWLRADPEVPGRYPGPLRFTHDDLAPEHVLLDPETGSLAGIIDWTDAALADPVLDFVFLVTWRGWPFAEAVLEAYPHPLDAGFRDRLRFLARALSLIWLDEAMERAPATAPGEGEGYGDGLVAKHVAWVEHAFGVG